MTYYVGDAVQLTVRVYDTDDTLSDPSALALTLSDPSGNDTSLTYAAGDLTRASAGVYTYDAAVDKAGWWKAVFTATEPTKLDVTRFYVEAAP